MKEKRYYPLIHFAPEFGWINDPNGLVVHDGIYELYYQCNPQGIEWGNMTWGHARSTDLIHWEECEPVLRPDENEMMYSGCGLRNEREALHFPGDALIFYYTAAYHNWIDPSKTRFTIRLAYSLDGGNTLIKTGEPVLESLYPDNRDPKVFWHEESGAYIMVLWLHNNDFGIFRSEDMEQFTLSQRLTLPGGYECPDLFALPVIHERTGESAEKKWVFWTADGTYFVGSFDGYRFVSEQPGRKANSMNSLPYAAQTFSGTEEILSISWLCTKCVGLRTTGAMSLPRVLSLVRDGESYLLRQNLPECIDRAAQNEGRLHTPGESVSVQEDAAIRMRIRSDQDWTIQIGTEDNREQFNVTFRYQGGSFIVTYQEVSTFILLGGRADALDFIFDRGIFEIASEDGRLVAVQDIAELRTKNWSQIMLLDGTANIAVESIR